MLVLSLAGCFSGPEDECQSDSDCPAGRVCDPTLKACLVDTEVDAGSWAIEWVSPTNNARVGSAVTLVAQVTTPTGETPPASVEFHGVLTGTDAGVAGTLSRTDAGSYSVAWEPESEGTYSFQAVVEPTNPDQTGALSDPLSLTVDLTAPVFGLVIPAAPTRPADSATTSWTDPSSSGAYRRDETTPVTVWSDAPDVDAASVHVSVVGFATPAPAPIEVTGLEACSAGNAHKGAKFCREGMLDLAKPELVGMRGTFTVSAEGGDDLRNTSSVDGSVEVTRWKWSYATGSGALNNDTPPAVGHQGVIYVGTADTSGELVAVNPDGSERWRASTGSMLTAPSVGETSDGKDRIYVAKAGPPTSFGIVAYSAEGGALANTCNGPNATEAAASLSIAPGTLGGETVFAAVEDSAGSERNLVAVQVDTSNCTTSAPGLVPLFPEGAITGDGTSLYFGTTSGGSVVKYTLAGTWSDNSGWAGDVQLTVPSVAVTGSGIAGGGGGPGEGGLFALDADSSALSWSYPPGSPASGFGTVGEVVAGADGLLFAGVTGASDAPANRIVATQIGTTSFAYQAASVAGAPILGENQRLYTVSPTGNLSVFEAADLTPIWSASVASGSVAASPNMDCTRNPDGSKAAGRPGVLYIPTTSGELFAVIVDSRGIDTSADWPKYLHDPRNTSNAKTSLIEFACP